MFLGVKVGNEVPQLYLQQTKLNLRRKKRRKRYENLGVS